MLLDINFTHKLRGFKHTNSKPFPRLNFSMVTFVEQWVIQTGVSVYHMTQKGFEFCPNDPSIPTKC